MKETLKEAAREYYKRGQLGFEKAADTERAFLKGGQWVEERMYSEGEILGILQDFVNEIQEVDSIKDWLEQYKKK